jgi:hypothetical protein
MNYSILKHKRTVIDTMSFLALTIGLITLMSTAPTVNAAFEGGGPNPTPTPPPTVGGEFVPVNILQLLAPYLIVAFLGAAAFVSLVIYKKRTT